MRNGSRHAQLKFQSKRYKVREKGSKYICVPAAVWLRLNKARTSLFIHGTRSTLLTEDAGGTCPLVGFSLR